MQLSPYEIALIAGGFTVVGAVLGSFITYRFALHLSSVNARRDAGRRLREAFAPELASLHPITGAKNIDMERFLQESWPKHHAAVSEVAFHLPQEQRAAFDKAWREYYEVGGSVRFFDYYIGDNPRQKFQERINAILKYTQI
jgi:hypothetical protein